MKAFYSVFLFLGIILLGTFHLRYLSRFFDWDSIVYALNIGKNRWESVFLNPHHLGFESSGLLYWKWIRSFWQDADLMFVLRIRILAVSMLFLFVFVQMFAKITKDFWGAVLIAFCIQSSQAYWFYSLHNDTPLIHSCLIAILYLGALSYSKSPDHTLHLIGLWLLNLIAIYFHQSNVIHFGIVPMAILLKPNGITLGSKLRTISIYLVTLGIAVIGSYLFIGFIILKRSLGNLDASHFSFWMFLYAAIERWGMSPGDKTYVQFFYRGIGDAFLVFQTVTPKFRVDFSQSLTKANLPYNTNVIFWLSIIASIVIGIRFWIHKFRNEMLLLVFWLVPSILFYTWWEGYFLEFWVGTTIGLWILAYFSLAAISPSFLPRFFRSLRHCIFFAMGIFLFVMNFSFSALPRSYGPKFGYTEGIQGDVFGLGNEKIYGNKF